MKMKKKKQINKWKVATIVLGIIFLLLVIQEQVFPDKIITITNGFELKQSEITELSNIYGNETFELCNVQTNKCINLKIEPQWKNG